MCVQGARQFLAALPYQAGSILLLAATACCIPCGPFSCLLLLMRGLVRHVGEACAAALVARSLELLLQECKDLRVMQLPRVAFWELSGETGISNSS